MLRVAEDWLRPIYDHLHRQLLQREVLHADETTLQVLKLEGQTARSKCYMWLYRTGGDAEHPIVLYEYQQNRKAENAEAFLKGFTGWLPCGWVFRLPPIAGEHPGGWLLGASAAKV